MNLIIILVSIIIKIIALTMVLFTFKSLGREKGAGDMGVFSKYLLLKRRYDLLKKSLLFVAAIVIVELFSLFYALVAAPGFFTDLQLLFSDIIFLGLSILLSQIYRVRTLFHDEKMLDRVEKELEEPEAPAKKPRKKRAKK